MIVANFTTASAAEVKSAMEMTFSCAERINSFPSFSLVPYEESKR